MSPRLQGTTRYSSPDMCYRLVCMLSCVRALRFLCLCLEYGCCGESGYPILYYKFMTEVTVARIIVSEIILHVSTLCSRG